ncbi:MAG: response regulator receiver modulated diguanylate phosphodiesterase [Frankiales bacterium]|nr:response regulator receiver modulated diguanylate phosphodiesterase [Frankiales bacterium]
MAELLFPFADVSILVVDDNADNLSLIEAVLARAGATQVSAESDPRQVPARLASIDPDLVVLDLRMPHVDGYQLLSEIAAYADGGYLPVLVLTADATRAAGERAMREGAHDFVTKPFDNADLVVRIRNLLHTRALRARGSAG